MKTKMNIWTNHLNGFDPLILDIKVQFEAIKLI